MLFRLTTLFLLLEFGRPQDFLRFLAPLHLPALVTIALGFTLLLSTKIDFSDKQTRLYLALLALMAVHVPLAENHFQALMGLRTMLLTFVVYLGIVMSINSVSRFRTLVSLWLGVHLLLAVHGFLVRGKGVGGFLGDENDFAMTLNMIVPYSFFLAQTEQKPRLKLLYLGLTGLFVLANVFTFSRGGFIGLVAVGLYCWLRSAKKIRSLAVIMALALLVSLFAREGYRERIDSIWQEGSSTGTGEDRVYMWKFAWKMFLDNPVIGVGQSNFPVRFSEYEGEERLYGVTRTWRAAHSLYFTLLPELGLVGAVIFLRMLYFFWKDIAAIRRSTPQRFKEARGMTPRILSYAHALEASLWGFLVSSIFISTLYYPNFWVTIGFVVALRRTVTLELSRTGAASVASDKATPNAIRYRPRPL
jgi:O-antigen ligase